VIAADLATPAGVEMVLADTAGLDIGLLVAAAGFGTSGEVLEVDSGDELTMIDVNCRAVVEMTLAMGRRFKERGAGGIVLLSSVLAFQGVARASTYAATKAFIQSFAEGIASELAPFGIDVIAAAPGPVRSGFAARARMTLGAADTPDAIAVGTLEALGRRRSVRPGRVSKLLGYALSGLPRWARVRVMSAIMGGMTSPRHG
jgi:short-subunit dehydrogenase